MFARWFLIFPVVLGIGGASASRFSADQPKGKPVPADVPPRLAKETGPIPLAEPEHPLDTETDKRGWTTVAGTYRAPTKATQAVVELHLLWAPLGRVRWGAVKFEQTTAPPA